MASIDSLSSLSDNILCEQNMASIDSLSSFSDDILGEQNMASIDRLSSLPDDILCHILSFLPTNISVSTSLLAQRWRFLWTYVPTLYFNGYYGNRTLDIINKVTSLYKVKNMNTFRLSYVHSCRESELDACINVSIVRYVKKLDISYFYQVMLPRVIAKCKTLVDLRLHNCVVPMTAGVVFLSALKKLHLDGVKYESDESLPNLLSGCPVLEDLIIDKFVLKNMFCCYIPSPTIKRLTFISKLRCRYEPYDEFCCTEMIDSSVEDFIFEDVSAGALTSLIDADIVLDCKRVIDGDLYSRTVLEFVGRLCNVKYLKLSTGWMMASDTTFSYLIVKFHNLIKLELAADWRFISYFLENADNLEVLIIRKVKCWTEPGQVPKCLSSRLRVVTIDQFACTEPEFELIRYLLWNAKVMKRMIIYFRCHGIFSTENSEALSRISTFQRGSIACELIFN